MSQHQKKVVAELWRDFDGYVLFKCPKPDSCMKYSIRPHGLVSPSDLTDAETHKPERKV